MSINEAKALHRRYLDPGQVTAWEKCIAQNADGGALLLSTSMPNKKQFALVVNWIPPKGVAQGQLDLKLAGGTIEGTSICYCINSDTLKKFENYFFAITRKLKEKCC